MKILVIFKKVGLTYLDSYLGIIQYFYLSLNLSYLFLLN